MGPHTESHHLHQLSIQSLHFYSTLLYSTLLYSTLLYSTLLYSTLLYAHSQDILILGQVGESGKTLYCIWILPYIKQTTLSKVTVKICSCNIDHMYYFVILVNKIGL